MYIKNYIAIFLLFSLSLIVSHDFIPHTHKDDTELQAHHQEDNGYEESNIFSFFQHQGQYLLIAPELSKNNLYKFVIFDFVSILLEYDSSGFDLDIPPKIREDFIYIPSAHLISCTHFRAPPFFIS
jgi:hypothetical protein